MARPKSDPIERLLAFIDRREDSECWIWRGGVNRAGYGNFWLDGKTLGAHQAAAKLLGNASVMNGEEIRHTCHQPLCCNPKHLITGTHSQNVRDSWDAGRKTSPTQRMSALDFDLIIASNEANTVLAERHGISRNHVWRIRRGMVPRPTQ